MPPSSQKQSSSPALRWSAGVPVGTNPLILLDFFTIMAVVFLLAWLILLAAQFYFDGFVQMQHVRGAAVVALDLCLLCTVFYVVVAFVALRNRYAAVYRFDANGAHCDNLKCFPRALQGAFLRFRAFPIEMPQSWSKSVDKHVPWGDVNEASELASLRVLLLKGRRGTLMRVYCPDDETYAAALRYAQEKLSA